MGASMSRGSLSSAELFDAAINPLREQEIAEMGLEVVARPGMAAPEQHVPGLFAISRGEGRLAVISAVERVAPSRAVLEAEGIPCDGYADGVFVEVDSALGGRRGLLISNRQGAVKRHVVLLRERSAPRRAPAPIRSRQFAEDDPTSLAALLTAAYALRRRRQRTVREEYLRSLLEPGSGTSPIA